MPEWEIEGLKATIKRLSKETGELKTDLATAESAAYDLMEWNDKLHDGLKVILDNSINPGHTMTMLGLTEVVDANFKVASKLLNHKEG